MIFARLVRGWLRLACLLTRSRQDSHALEQRKPLELSRLGAREDADLDRILDVRGERLHDRQHRGNGHHDARRHQQDAASDATRLTRGTRRTLAEHRPQRRREQAEVGRVSAAALAPG